VKEAKWSGVYPALTTQFRQDASVDLEATATHLETLIEAGIHGVIVLGTVGEGTSLAREEKVEVLQMAVKVSGGRIPVLSGVAEYTTAGACGFAAAAERVGADGLMVLPGMVYKADSRETVAHFRSVARASRLPVMIYNNPVSYSIDTTPQMLRELSDEPTIVAVKESSDDIRRITDIVNLLGDRYILFCGVDDLALEGAMLGAQGWVSGLVNAFPHENRTLWELATCGDWVKARELYRWYTPLLHLDTKIKLVQYIKLAMAEVGLGSEMVRAPRLPLEGAEREQILGIIRHAIATRPEIPARAAQTV
jgi:1-pyrroline-4-hydroxy-2-carboxylate deaminase